VSTVDLLQSIINHLFVECELVPHVHFDEHEFHVAQYADDTLLFMEASLDHLKVLKEALHKLQLATGYMINFYKSYLVAININDVHAILWLSFFMDL
jgi:hypothetical protein